MIDGMNQQLAVATRGVFVFSQLNIQEVVAEFGGNAEADFGGTQLKMVPREGGNTFSGQATFTYSGSGMEASNINDALLARNLDPERIGSLKKYRDTGVALGGPLMESKLWFYASAREGVNQLYVDGVQWNAAPVDSMLPGGGGNELCGLYDVTPALFNQVDNLIRSASDLGGSLTRVYNGVEAAVTARFGNGGQLSGGINVGRTVTDNCLVVDSPEAARPDFCRNGLPFLDQRGRFLTEEARVVERVTLIDANTMHFQATYEDPNVYTRPFTIAFAFRRNVVEQTEVWEEACYETNAEQMQLFRNNGLRVHPGISAREARELKTTWEAGEAQR